VTVVTNTVGANTEWKRLAPLPKLVPVVGFQVAASGTYCILADGRMYEKVLDEWRVCMPPLTEAQREAR
jgi:hypothetical protein